jgi:hypothetical protein
MAILALKEFSMGKIIGFTKATLRTYKAMGPSCLNQIFPAFVVGGEHFLKFEESNLFIHYSSIYSEHKAIII